MSLQVKAQNIIPVDLLCIALLMMEILHGPFYCTTIVPRVSVHKAMQDLYQELPVTYTTLQRT